MTRRRRFARVTVVLSAALLMVSQPSAAAGDEEPAMERKAPAREAYRLGNALAKAGQWRDALAAFSRSANLYPHPATSFNIAYCERALGHLVRARRFFRLALEQHAAGGGLSDARVAQSTSYLSELGAKVVHLTVTLRPGVWLSVDAAPLEPDGDSHAVAPRLGSTRIDHSPLALVLDPGNHLLSARRHDGETVELSLSLGAGERRTVSLPFSPPAPPPSDELTRWGIVTVGAGASGLLVGALFGIAALDKRALLDERCPAPSACPAVHEGDIDTLRRTARASTIALSIGGAVAAAGIVMIVVDASGSAETSVGPGGLRIAFD
jgi:hypothetical protein